jgi:SsrA-binding protein
MSKGKKKKGAYTADGRRLIASNKKALYRFEILDELEAGVVLLGTEVKSLRGGQCSLQEAYVRIKRGELWLVGAHVPEYAFGNSQNHEPTRERKLLVHRRELAKWDKQVREKGMTMVPLEVYFKDARVKVRIGLARGKRVHDKRAAARRKDDQRDMDRAMSRRR